MGLQLRVRHALGARVVEIEPRSAERPIVIGRTAEADVQVPIGTVAPSHCVLYMDQDQWVIQDNGSSTGTYVNGSAISGPVYLNFGDLVALGESESAPTIEIDPMGTARRNRPLEGGLEGRPAQPTEQEPQALYPDAAGVASRPKENDWLAEAEEGDAFVDLGGAARRGVRRRRPAPKRRDYVGITIGAAIAIILLGWFVVAKMMKEDEPQQAGEPAVQDVRGGGRSKGGGNIFDYPETDKPKAAAQSDQTVLPPVAVAPAAVDDPPKPASTPTDNDPERRTDEWKAVVDANAPAEKPGRALWTIVDYRRLHPGKFEAELKQYEDAAFDRLWWERIKELFELRDSLQMEIDKKNAEIAQETEPAFKEKLVKEKEFLQFRRQNAIEALTQEMGYAAPSPPNLFDPAQLATLRQKRIPETYEGWKRRVISSLMRTRGLPWERTR